MLSEKQLQEFETRGVVRVAAGVDPQVAGGFRERLLAFVAERKLAPTGSGQWLAVYPSLTAPVAKRYGFAELWGPTVLGALDQLIGAGRWHVPRHAGQILALLSPQPEQRWHVPDKGWHLDYAAPGAATALPGAAPRTRSKRRSSRPSGTTASECRVNSARSAALQLSLHPASPREAGFFAQDVSNARLRQSRPGKKARSAETPCLRRLRR